MAKKSEYRILAEKIAKNINRRWGCCMELPYPHKYHFAEIFRPKEKERRKYNCSVIFWMSKYAKSNEQDNEFRILALLFMDEFTKTDKV